MLLFLWRISIQRRRRRQRHNRGRRQQRHWHKQKRKDTNENDDNNKNTNKNAKTRTRTRTTTSTNTRTQNEKKKDSHPLRRRRWGRVLATWPSFGGWARRRADSSVRGGKGWCRGPATRRTSPRRRTSCWSPSSPDSPAPPTSAPPDSWTAEEEFVQSICLCRADTEKKTKQMGDKSIGWGEAIRNKNGDFSPFLFITWKMFIIWKMLLYDTLFSFGK